LLYTACWAGCAARGARRLARTRSDLGGASCELESSLLYSCHRVERRPAWRAPERDADLPEKVGQMPCREGRGLVSRLSAGGVLHKTREGLLSQALECVERDDFVPGHLRAVAALGQLANPIVSFNIEPFSSILLARPGGPVRLLGSAASGDSEVRVAGRVRSLSEDRLSPARSCNRRQCDDGAPIQSKRAKPRVTLAINVAFANTLLIVGMSLNDDYLRQHIEAARDDLREIYWFDSSFQRSLPTGRPGIGLRL